MLRRTVLRGTFCFYRERSLYRFDPNQQALLRRVFEGVHNKPGCTGRTETRYTAVTLLYMLYTAVELQYMLYTAVTLLYMLYTALRVLLLRYTVFDVL